MAGHKSSVDVQRAPYATRLPLEETQHDTLPLPVRKVIDQPAEGKLEVGRATGQEKHQKLAASGKKVNVGPFRAAKRGVGLTPTDFPLESKRK